MSDDIEVTESSGNVFADIGVSEPEEALAKADVAIRLCELIADRGLSQRRAAAILGIDQPKVSALMRGRLEGFSLGRLFRFLNALDSDVEIVIKPKREPSERGSTRVVAA